MRLEDKPINPVPGKTHYYPEGNFSEPAFAGMTLLEHYAGLAMQALATKEVDTRGLSSEEIVEILAENSVRVAKALIAELEKVQP